MQNLSYKNNFLVAMPNLQNEFFSKAVIFIYEHSEEEGTIGFAINKPLSATLGNVLEHLKIKIKDTTVSDKAVFSGGPVGPDQGFIIHDRMSVAQNEQDEHITISTSREILKEVSAGKGPENYIITLGYAGWAAGQLEAEILHNDWLLVPFDKELIFNAPIAERWTLAAKSVGVDIYNLSDQIGHA